MNVNIQTVHFDADRRLIEHIERKLAKIRGFFERITSVDVFLKVDNPAHHIKDKVAEIRVQVPQHEFFVKQVSKSFELSFDSAFQSVVSQIKRHKDKRTW
ncbi:MAG: ribosome-associated translation inhibitor RaiA [Dinghuibacter sp.]|nr:ribosome-associated translation inhibitor RaiA [Dinghuibacter sp.]